MIGTLGIRPARDVDVDYAVRLEKARRGQMLYWTQRQWRDVALHMQGFVLAVEHGDKLIGCFAYMVFRDATEICNWSFSEQHEERAMLRMLAHVGKRTQQGRHVQTRTSDPTRRDQLHGYGFKCVAYNRPLNQFIYRRVR